MKEFLLNNGTPAQINTWDLEKIREYTSCEIPVQNLNNMGDQSFVGFAFFGPHLPKDLLRVDPDNNYPGRENEHRAVVATIGKEVAGIIAAQWVKFTLPFWHYHVRWIDVREDYKNQGVGTNLARYLNEADFIKGKILFLGMLTQEGSMYIAKVMKKELKAKDYTLVFEDQIPKNPKRFGKFGGKYWG